jgi:hypothetical protein
MTEDEAIALQATVDEILVLAGSNLRSEGW